MGGTAAVRETAYAKINLALHVRERLADGYHRIETLFAFARDGDTLAAEPDAGLTLAIDGPFAVGLSAGSDNLVLRAAAALRAAFGVEDGAALRLTKTLPVAAGLGGGSADAAAALRLLVRLWRLPAADPRVADIAAGLGADVPACLGSRSCRGEGRGEQLTPIADDALAGTPMLLVNPGVPVSTPAVFAGWDGIDRGGLADADPLRPGPAWRNDLTAPALALVPAVADIIEALGESARFARMSGSGPTCFGLFASAAERDEAADRLAAAHPGWWQLPTALR